jgi:hypothetical protein
LKIFRLPFGLRIVRIDERAHNRRARHQLAQQVKFLGIKLRREQAYARDIAGGAAEASDKTRLHRVGCAHEHDRDFGRCRLRYFCRIGATGSKDDRCMTVNQVLGELRQPTIVPSGPAVFDGDVLAFNVSRLFQALRHDRLNARSLGTLSRSALAPVPDLIATSREVAAALREG